MHDKSSRSKLFLFSCFHLAILEKEMKARTQQAIEQECKRLHMWNNALNSTRTEQENLLQTAVEKVRSLQRYRGASTEVYLQWQMQEIHVACNTYS